MVCALVTSASGSHPPDAAMAPAVTHGRPTSPDVTRPDDTRDVKPALPWHSCDPWEGDLK
jgi:hypothetical protein